ncbi:myosin-2 essential light chain-like [Choristoneura fumiferana]|uniref:myosin-2 essential light chain-like n=1 Tax=Choristoneura fumiferana TaxID=7141 RepID=UPI003D159113
MFMYEPPSKLQLTSVEEFQEAFQLFDSRGDGKIHVAQVGDALRALGQNPTESDVKKCTHHLKPDERISFEVFLPIYQAISKARSGDTAHDFIEGLRHFDKDGNGFISSAELRICWPRVGESWPTTRYAPKLSCRIASSLQGQTP